MRCHVPSSTRAGQTHIAVVDEQLFVAGLHAAHVISVMTPSKSWSSATSLPNDCRNAALECVWVPSDSPHISTMYMSRSRIE